METGNSRNLDQNRPQSLNSLTEILKEVNNIRLKVEEMSRQMAKIEKQEAEKREAHKRKIKKIKKIIWVSLSVILIAGLVFLAMTTFKETVSSLFQSSSSNDTTSILNPLIQGDSAGTTQSETKENAAESDNEAKVQHLTITSVTASSFMKSNKDLTYYPQNTIDDDLQTWWSPAPPQSDGRNSWLKFDFSGNVNVSAISILNGSHYPNYSHYGDLYLKNNRLLRANLEFSNGNIQEINLQETDENQKISFTPQQTTYIKVIPVEWAKGSEWNDLCISDFKAYGVSGSDIARVQGDLEIGEIKSIIDNLYKFAKDQSYEELGDLFANPIERYYSLTNVLPKDVVNDRKQYAKKFLIISTNVDFNSLKVSSNSEKSSFEISYDLEVVVENVKSNTQTKFYETINMKMNGTYKIFYITEKVNSKENVGNVSQTDNNPRVPFYIINVAAVSSEMQAQAKVAELKKTNNSAGYLWIPDYASLSGAKYYCVYIGPFSTQQACEIATENYKKIQTDAYGLIVSQEKKRVQINGIGKVVTTRL